MSGKRERPRQYTLSQKVSEERKRAFARRCAEAGLSQSEMLERCVFGRLPDEAPLPTVVREQLALIHQLRACVAPGTVIDDQALNGLADATRALITEVRHTLA
jgi:hypothetical protein